ncbi:MAG: superoxide dismutase [Cu-Zn] SodC [Pseudomonadota bacterium]|uniref:superoxide dismutase family protein n=1 Tax=Thermithiobacillus tepidarius TaxID=929 RepID=UPI0003FF3246|nr:superoxide dismutase family protein [Thermithiobacillus tepidarius]
MKPLATASAILCFSLAAAGCSHTGQPSAAASGPGVTVVMHEATPSGVGRELGTVRAADGPNGLVLTAQLRGLPAGVHGFHVHENPSCAPKEQDGKMVPAAAAGGHYDPEKTGRHEGPYGKGHLGDLPPLTAQADGSVDMSVVAPRLKLADIRNRSLMVHAGGDNFADHPHPLGGGGARIACGVVQ